MDLVVVNKMQDLVIQTHYIGYMVTHSSCEGSGLVVGKKLHSHTHGIKVFDKVINFTK